MRRRASGRGFTLLEVIFAVIIVGVLFGAVYNIFSSQTSTAHRLGRKNEAMGSCLVAAEVIERDLRRLVTVPVQRKPDGTIERHFGDHSAPVFIPLDPPIARHIAFYVPKDPSGAVQPLQPGQTTKECVTVAYSLVPTGTTVPKTNEPLYYLKRSILDSPAALVAAGNDLTAESMPGTLVKGVVLKDLRFRLLDPKAPSEQFRSPDMSYYLEAIVVGADTVGLEQETVPLLINLEYPSTLQMTPSIQEVITYQPTAPLVTPPARFQTTPQEVATIRDFANTTQNFLDGTLPPAEFERRLTDIVNQHSGQPNGPIVGTTGNLIPRIDRLTIPTMPRPGEPIVARDPATNTVIVVPPPQPTGTSGPPVVAMTPPTGNWWFTGVSAVLRNGVLVNANKVNGGGTGQVSDQQLQGLVDGWVQGQTDLLTRTVANNQGNNNVQNAINQGTQATSTGS